MLLDPSRVTYPVRSMNSIPPVLNSLLLGESKLARAARPAVMAREEVPLAAGVVRRDFDCMDGGERCAE